MSRVGERLNMGRKAKGYSGLRMLIFILVALILFAISVVVFYEGRKAYWDYRVQEMCEEEGGVFIVEKVKITKEEIKSMGKVGGYISIPLKSSSGINYPVYYIYTEKVIRKSRPRVTRWEEKIYRKKNNEIVAVIVKFKRSGGDFPSHSHSSSFSCPENNAIYKDRESVFIIQGD